MNADQFLNQKALNAVREHARARLKLERDINDKAELMLRLAAVAKASTFTNPGLLVQTCRNIHDLSQEMNLIADQIELMHRKQS